MLNGFLRALIGLLALGGIADLEFRENCAVQFAGRFGRRLTILHQRHAQFVQLFPPGIARLIDVRIGEDVVEENVFGDSGPPRRLFSRPVSEVHVLQQEVGAEGFQVALGHIGHQEGHALALALGRLSQGFLQFAAIVPGSLQRFFDRLRPGDGCIRRWDRVGEKERTGDD